MKKFLAIFVILAMAAPVFAANEITLTAADAGNGQLAISYDATGSDDMPVGISFRVSLSNGATVAADAAAVVAASADFNVYIDYVNTLTATYDPCDFVPGGPYAKGDGIPMANTDTAGAIAAAASEFAICMGRLEETDAPASGALLTLQLDIPNGTTEVTITADTVRGEVVGSTFTVNYPGVITIGDQKCLYVGRVFNNGLTVTQAMVDKWTALGEPDCWCCEAQKYGNAAYAALSAQRVDVFDLSAVKQSWMKLSTQVGYIPCADFNLSGRVDVFDLNILKLNWMQSVGPCPDPQ